MASHNVALGANLGSVVGGFAAGDTYVFPAGIFYGTQFQPQANDIYIGDPNGSSILSGAWRVTSWVNDSGNLWHATQGLSNNNGTTQTNFPAPSMQGLTLTASLNTTGGGQMVVTVTSGVILTGMSVWNAAGTISAGAYITGQLSGTGGSTGTYSVSVSLTVGSATVYCTSDYGGMGSGAGNFCQFDEELWLNNTRVQRIGSPGPATSTANWWWNPANSSINVFSVGNPAIVSTLTASMNTTANAFSSGQMVVTATSATITIGMYVWNAAQTIPWDTRILGQISGTAGSTGTYAVSSSVTVSSGTVLVGNCIEYACLAFLCADVGGPGVRGISWQGMTVEKYSNKISTGVVHGVMGWTMLNSTFRWNHSCGPVIGSGSTINNCKLLTNGQAGMEGGVANQTKILNSEVAYNNWAGYNTLNDAGGIKNAGQNGSTISGNYVHDNQGVGIWIDLEGYGNIISNNLVTNCIGFGNVAGGSHGIMYEVSHGFAIISNNVVSGCLGTGIFISNSNNVEVRGNIVTVGLTNTSFYGGIIVINEARGYSTSAPFPIIQTINNNIHQNTVVHISDTAYDGIVIGQPIVGPSTVALTNLNTTFDYNTYITPNTTGSFWNFDAPGGTANGTTNFTWATLQAAATWETHGQNLVGPIDSMSQLITLFASGQAAGSITPASVRALILAVAMQINYSAPYME